MRRTTAEFFTPRCRHFCSVLLQQAAGTILRRGIHLEGGDEDYWREWVKDVTGDGTSLNEFCRKTLVDSLLYGHSSILVDYSAEERPLTLAEELRQGRKPYLVSVPCQHIRGWRTEGNRPHVSPDDGPLRRTSVSP